MTDEGVVQGGGRRGTHLGFMELKRWSIFITMGFVALLLAYVILGMAGFLIYGLFIDNSILYLTKEEILHVLGSFLMVVVILEIMETMWLYATKDEIHVESVVLIAITAIANQMIVFDFQVTAGSLLAGTGVLVISLAAAFYLIRTTQWHSAEKKQDGEAPDKNDLF
jgi:uncharacterized membrane protein (DUF373 family)